MIFETIASDHLLDVAVTDHRLTNTTIVEAHHHHEAIVHHAIVNVHLVDDHRRTMNTMTEVILVDLLQEIIHLHRGDMRIHMTVGLLPHLLPEGMILTLVEILTQDPEALHQLVAMAAMEVVLNIEATMSADRTRQVCRIIW